MILATYANRLRKHPDMTTGFFYEPCTEIVFRSSIYDIRRAVEELNKAMYNTGEAPIEGFFNSLKIDASAPEIDEFVGWYIGNDVWDFNWSYFPECWISVSFGGIYSYTKDGRPVRELIWDPLPDLPGYDDDEYERLMEAREQYSQFPEMPEDFNVVGERSTL